MKTIFIYITLFFVCYPLFSQEYKPLLKDGNQWRNLVYKEIFNDYNKSAKNVNCIKDFSPNVMYSTEILALKSDSIINTLTYKKLYLYTDTLLENGTLAGLIREDIAGRKVYFKNEDEPEFLLYDFYVNENDTIINKEFESKVISIDSIEIDGQYHKVIQLSTANTWIEGIGGINGLITSYRPKPICATISYSLLCFFNNGQLIYKPESSETYGCYYYKSFQSVKLATYNSLYKFYPNPLGNVLTLESASNLKFDIEIYNIQGKLLKHKKDLFQKMSINTSDLRSGLYFIKITDNTGKFFYKITKM